MEFDWFVYIGILLVFVQAVASMLGRALRWRF